MTPEENKLFIQRFVEETIDRKNLDAIDELVAENFVEHVPFPHQGPEREGLRYALDVFLSAFPDIQWILDEQVADGGKVVSRFTWTGTHRGEFLGIPPTGKRVKVWGVVMDVVRAGTLSESRIIMDTPRTAATARCDSHATGGVDEALR
jgi:predicted ester cyclase